MSDPAPSPAQDEIESIASLDFQPWTHHDGEWTPPSNAEWTRLANPHLISTRIAWLTLHKSKPELAAMADELGDQGLMELVAQIGRTADWFKGVHELLSAAECRIMCAYAWRVEADEEGGDCSGET